VFLPTMIWDDSCHNLFRDGRRLVRAQFGAKLKLAADDWPQLNRMFADLGTSHSLSLRADEKIRSGRIVWRTVSVCNEDGVAIEARYEPWLAAFNTPLTADGLYTLVVYELKTGSGWSPLARELFDKINTTWPDRATFSGPGSQIIPFEEAIKGRN
jgi:hypothetical protein